MNVYEMNIFKAKKNQPKKIKNWSPSIRKKETKKSKKKLG